MNEAELILENRRLQEEVDKHRAALRQLWNDTVTMLVVNSADARIPDMLAKTDKACRELGVLPPVYEKQ